MAADTSATGTAATAVRRGADEIGPLLHLARRALAGELTVPPARATRTAAVLGRAALEAIIAVEGIRLGIADHAKARTRLICLRVLGDPKVGHLAGLAWAGLSNACHHHSYELSPTTGEVAHLLDLVDQTRTSISRGAASANLKR